MSCFTRWCYSKQCASLNVFGKPQILRPLFASLCISFILNFVCMLRQRWLIIFNQRIANSLTLCFFLDFIYENIRPSLFLSSYIQHSIVIYVSFQMWFKMCISKLSTIQKIDHCTRGKVSTWHQHCKGKQLQNLKHPYRLAMLQNINMTWKKSIIRSLIYCLKRREQKNSSGAGAETLSHLEWDFQYIHKTNIWLVCMSSWAHRCFYLYMYAS